MEWSQLMMYTAQVKGDVSLLLNGSTPVLKGDMTASYWNIKSSFTLFSPTLVFDWRDFGWLNGNLMEF